MEVVSEWEKWSETVSFLTVVRTLLEIASFNVPTMQSLIYAQVAVIYWHRQVKLAKGSSNNLRFSVTPSYKSKKWDKTSSTTVAECGLCGPKAKIVKTDMPYVMIYLAAELACMNVKMEFKFDQNDMRRDYEIVEKSDDY